MCGNHPYPRINDINYQQACYISFKLTQDSSRLDYSADFHYELNISAVVSGKTSTSGICTFVFSTGAVAKLVSAVQLTSTAFIAHTTTLSSKLHPVVNNQKKFRSVQKGLKARFAADTVSSTALSPPFLQPFCSWIYSRHKEVFL